MAKEMIVSVNGREKKIAILDNGKVTEFYIERGEENSGVVGNVYKGRVMRVLPGMQSAFVDIGLERDAFLYVSDFFDEDEEIERIVMNKKGSSSPEDAKREANDQIERSRMEREKQMDSTQELAEPLAESTQAEAPAVEEPSIEVEIDDFVPAAEPEPKKGRSPRSRGKRGKAVEAEPVDTVEDAPVIEIDFDNSGFERISDDADTGEMFKDAYVQEAIVDRVRAIEFDMESSADTEVGSLLAEVGGEAGGFERIADEDDEPAPAPAKKTRRKAKSADDSAEEKPEAKKKPAAKKPVAKGKFSKPKKKKEDGLADAEASESSPDDKAEMAVRRGGRGRRRGGKVRPEELLEEGVIGDDAENVAEQPEADEKPATEQVVEAQPEEREAKPREESSDDQPRQQTDDRGQDRDRDRDRNRRNPRGGRDRDRPAADGKKFERNDRNDRGGRPQQPTISDLLREGQEILVQIAKEPIAKKGARITSHIALPGRYLVYMPTIEHLGVSRKIESSTERNRLRGLIQRIRQDAGIPAGGFIVRTAGIGISEEDLRNDAKYLAKMWAESKKGSEKKKSPALVHQDLDLVQRILRDQLSDDFAAIRVDSEEEYLRTVEFINLIQPRLVNRIKLYTRDEPILDYYGVQEEIDKALKPRVWLRSGGYLVINQTEALVSIDVNTGKFVGKGNARLEDTITKTNMEAVDEIARQIRLRDLGGIIVLDLIDMEDRRNRHKVSQALQEALASDRSPTKVLSFNDFGLIIMTRKRVKQSLERTMCTPCDYCEGAGWVKSPITVCYEILAEARRLSKQVEDVRQTTLRVHPDVTQAFRSSEREVLDEIEHYLGHIDINSDKSIHQAQFDFAFV